MEAVKVGEVHKASLLFDRYHKRIYHFLTRLAMDREMAEDLTQNVFVRVIRYRQSYRQGLKVQAWIFQIARNVFADHYHQQKNRKSEWIDITKMSDQVADAEEGRVQEEQEKLLERSMAKLSDEQRELLVLTRFQHMKYEEVAAIMDTTVANIKVKVHRAIARLREHYFELEKS